MIRHGARAGVLALAVSLSWTGSAVEAPPDSGSPSWAERWLYNPRERTEAARESLNSGGIASGKETVVERLDTARRLAPDDPTTLYNAGTGRLIAEARPERAAELLERATELAPPDLAPHALFNLGNARLADERPEAAISAYRDALRLAPDLRPAKRNLEVALARLDRERTERAERPSREPGEEAESREQGSGADRSGRERSREADGRGAGTAGTAGTGPDPASLPRFDEQADMTAGQAAALLEAIENLERRQRLQESVERAERAGTTRGKDW